MGAFLRQSLVWGILGLCMTAGLFAQQKATFRVAGPCVACGSDRIIGIVKGLDGVSNASYDAGSSMLTVAFDPVSASLIDIQLELSIKGYDAGDFTRDASANLPDCARGGGMRGDEASDDLDVSIDDIDGLEKDTDWENPDAFELVGTSGDDDIDILGDDLEEDDDDISTFVDGDEADEVPNVSDDEEDDDDSDE